MSVPNVNVTGMRASGSLVLGPVRALGTVAVVAALTGAYAAVVIMMSTVLATGSDHDIGDFVNALLATASTVFILIALYVGAIVIANGIDTVIAGRRHEIAMLRLLGARSRDLRRAIAVTTALVGGGGAIGGAAAGTIAAIGIRREMVRSGALPAADYPRFDPMIAIAVCAVVLTALLAGWLASRAVLTVAPSQAIGRLHGSGPVGRPHPAVRRRAALTLIAGGVLILGIAMLLGERTPGLGFIAAFLGAAVSGGGLLLGARVVVPATVAACGRLLGRSAAADIARRNAVSDPTRTTRSTIGLAIGVTLVTTIASGMRALRLAVESWDLDGEQRALADELLRTATNVLLVVVAVSSLIAVVGFVSTMSLTVIQRRRELGLLRALGFTRGDVRAMITKESTALLAAAVTLGIALGVVYGSIGAQSITGFLSVGFVWGVPLPVLGIVVALSVLVTFAASQPPARRAIRVPPIDALRTD